MFSSLIRNPLIAAVVSVASVASLAPAWAFNEPSVTENPADVAPLKVGDSVPVGTLHNREGTAVELHALLEARPTVVIFYRGGWCPYCNTHLEALAEIEPKLTDMGFQIVALSPDKPEKIAQTDDKYGFSYELYSDADMSVARAFGLAFRVDDATNERLKKYKIDLEAASGESHRQLPVPAVFIVSTDKQVKFVHFEPDYTKRLSAEAILEAAQSAR